MHATVQDALGLVSKPIDDPAASAVILSSNLQVYQSLFGLMSAPSFRVQQSAWELLKLLPPAPQLVDAITNRTLQFAGLFSPRHTLQLLFNLNIMDGILKVHAFETYSIPLLLLLSLPFISQSFYM
jgi:hypothetical protein